MNSLGFVGFQMKRSLTIGLKMFSTSLGFGIHPDKTFAEAILESADELEC